MPVAAGFWFYGVYHVAVNVLYGLGKTRMIAGYVLAGAVLNLLLNYYLIPVWGVVGAALATTLAFAFLAVLTLGTTERLVAVGFSYRLIVGVVLSASVLWLMSSQLSSLPGLVRLPLRLLVIALFAPVVMATRTFGLSDFARGLGFLRGGPSEDAR